MNKKLCLLTTSHGPDIGPFSLLRRSIELFATGLPHIVVVNTEDCAAFRDRFGEEAGLEIVSSSSVLPRDIERRRRKSGPGWLTGKWLHKRLIKGWHAQQLMKIYALADCPYEAAVFMDSDVFFCRPLTAEYFYVDGRLKLFRRRAVDAESLDFDISTHDILGHPLHQVTELFDHIFSPACFKRSTATRLLEELVLRGRSEARWQRKFLEQRRPSEYNLLGYAATVLQEGAGYHLLECNPDDLHHSIRFPEDRVRLAEEIEQMRTRPKDFVLIQSSLRLPFTQISRAFDEIADAHRQWLCSSQ
jgi:hypothetical protein